MSVEFAVVIVNLIDSVSAPKSSYMTDQLARAGTSVGANIHEAQYAHGTRDFISKFEISLKEVYETEYWLELLERSELVSSESLSHLIHDCRSIRRMLVASVNTAKSNT